MLETVIIALIALVPIGILVYLLGRPNPYSKMTDEEFEEDTKRSSILGSVIIGAERALRRREADYVIEQKLRVEKDATQSGDKPHPGNPESTDTEQDD